MKVFSIIILTAYFIPPKFSFVLNKDVIDELKHLNIDIPEGDEYNKLSQITLWAEIKNRQSSSVLFTKLAGIMILVILVISTMLALISIHFIFIYECNNAHRSRILMLYTDPYEGRSYTRESGVVPGSSEHLEPNKWTERLFELQKLQKIDLSKPSQLNMVVLLNKKKIPYYCKIILEKYGLLNATPFQFQVVKNTPSVNEDLLKVSPFIKVVPIKFPHGIPKTAQDFLNAKLLPNGDLILHTGLKIDGSIIENNDISDDEKVKALIYQYNKHTERSLNSSIYLSHNRIDWKRNRFLKEYFINHYQYKHNQDGKEYRYSNMWRITNALKQSLGRKYNEDGTIRMNYNHEADWNTYPWRNY